tara:strand:+ start:117 stop:593 length:477 start_codon:yes stop_codon:yes gene_type:complete
MATLTVTLTEDLTLNGYQQGSSNSFAVASVTQVLKKIITLKTGVDTTIASFQADQSTSDNAIDLQSVRYIRITNLEASNPVDISLQIAAAEGGTANMSASILLEAGKSFVMGSVHDGIAVSDANATIVTALTDLESILMNPGTNAVNIEIFIASLNDA